MSWTREFRRSRVHRNEGLFVDGQTRTSLSFTRPLRGTEESSVTLGSLRKPGSRRINPPSLPISDRPEEEGVGVRSTDGETEEVSRREGSRMTLYSSVFPFSRWRTSSDTRWTKRFSVRVWGRKRDVLSGGPSLLSLRRTPLLSFPPLPSCVPLHLRRSSRRGREERKGRSLR